MVRQLISEIFNGPGTSGGYRTVWHTLEMEGLRIPRMIVQDMLKRVRSRRYPTKESSSLKEKVISQSRTK